MDGITAIGHLRRELPDTEVIALTSVLEDDTVIGAARRRAIGYLLDDEPGVGRGDRAEGERPGVAVGHGDRSGRALDTNEDVAEVELELVEGRDRRNADAVEIDDVGAGADRDRHRAILRAYCGRGEDGAEGAGTTSRDRLPGAAVVEGQVLPGDAQRPDGDRAARTVGQCERLGRALRADLGISEGRGYHRSA